MRIAFDPAKNRANIAFHGVALSDAEKPDWDALLAVIDDRRDYGEERWVGYAPLDDRLHCVVFVERDDALRIISLRKANSREVSKYEQSQAG